MLLSPPTGEKASKQDDGFVRVRVFTVNTERS